MGKDYAKANWIPVGNYWKGRLGNTAPLAVIIHGTASGGHQTGRDLGLGEFNNQNSNASVHYAIDKDGTVTQFISEKDTAWGNCCVTDTASVQHNPHFVKGKNQNPRTISIEHLKYTTDNSDEITPQQRAASFDLIYDICKRNSIPMEWIGPNGGIAYHASIDVVNRSRCPGNYPLKELLAYLKERSTSVGSNERIAPVVQLSSTGEVRDMAQADQFQPHKSQFECGFFAVAIASASAHVGKSPLLSVSEIITQAERDYANVYGSNDISMSWGMSKPQLYNLLALHGMGFRVGDVSDAANIARAWLKLGYIVIAAIGETSVYDEQVGGSPYPWRPAGNHVIVLTGVASNGRDFLVRDAANCTNLYDAGSLRPGPRTYRAADLAFVSITAVICKDQIAPPLSFDPRKDVLSMVPTGWKLEGSTLIAPNNIKVIKGFAAHIMSHSWDHDDVPLEAEHPMTQMPDASYGLGRDGVGQLFSRHYLRWTQAHNVWEERVGYMLSLSEGNILKGDKEYKLALEDIRRLSAEKDQLTKELQAAETKLAAIEAGDKLEEASEVAPAPIPVVLPVVEVAPIVAAAPVVPVTPAPEPELAPAAMAPVVPIEVVVPVQAPTLESAPALSAEEVQIQQLEATLAAVKTQLDSMKGK